MANQARGMIVGMLVGGVGLAVLVTSMPWGSKPDAEATLAIDARSSSTIAEVETPASNSRAEVQTPDSSSQSSASGEAGSGDSVPVVPPKENSEPDLASVELKYSGADLGQLLAAKSVLEDRLSEERDRISKEMIAAGQLVEVPKDENGKFAPLAGSKDGSPVSWVSSYDFVDGASVVKAAVIDGASHPEYRALELEVWWLDNQVHKLKKQAKAQAATGR